MSALSENRIYLATFLSAILFFLIFSGLISGLFDFWSLFSAILLVLLTAGLKIDPLFSYSVFGDFKDNPRRGLVLGLISAAALYVIFWLGHRLVLIWFPGLSVQLSSVYALKAGSSRWRIGLFLALIIGPGEELWWRGFLQRHWMARLGKLPGMLVVSVLYATVHLGSGNLLLVLAALMGGLWWGFQYVRFNSLLANVISHTLWDLLVFLVIPFG